MTTTKPIATYAQADIALNFGLYQNILNMIPITAKPHWTPKILQPQPPWSKTMVKGV